ncbi:MAG: aminoglycoside phosphotransferase family protein [Anaerolineales bacterium]|nr:aminoglycoside phosphotransferase family protein [Anaerolineales bacterium]
MLEKPDLQDEKIAACLKENHGLVVSQIEFLPLGADMNTAVYRVVADDEKPYFVKLRMGNFEETAVTLPKFLSDAGIPNIIAPLANHSGQLWSEVESFKLILYPFIEGRDGYEIDLSVRHWVEFGTALKRIHNETIPSQITANIQRETFSPQWRKSVKSYLAGVERDDFPANDSVAQKVAALLKSKSREIIALIQQTELLAKQIKSQASEFIVCHSDIHAGNILIDSSDKLYIVDWDNPIFAPRERDLMYIGGGQFANKRTANEEENLFYEGYGYADLDQAALAYYRYERIIQDIAAYCDQLLLTNEGGEDREPSYQYLASNFLPNGTLELAHQQNKTRFTKE